jgi:hypothetical protein
MADRFLVPQYIETEPKILGPVTVRQFIIMLVAGLLGFVVWQIFDTLNQIAGAVIIFIQTMIFILFAFAKVNGQGFHYFFLNIVRTLKRPGLKVWKKAEYVKVREEEMEKRVEVGVKKIPPKSRLSDLALLVDTGGAYNVDMNGKGVQEEDISI